MATTAPTAVAATAATEALTAAVRDARAAADKAVAEVAEERSAKLRLLQSINELLKAAARYAVVVIRFGAGINFTYSYPYVPCLYACTYYVPTVSYNIYYTDVHGEKGQGM